MFRFHLQFSSPDGNHVSRTSSLVKAKSFAISVFQPGTIASDHNIRMGCFVFEGRLSANGVHTI